METKLLLFNSEEFGNIRTICEGDRILFCAKDVAVALGYSNPRKAVGDHCKEVTKRDTLTEGGIQSLSYLPEGDVYRLIVGSKLPSAQRFEAWLFETVVPSIRKHGAYMTESTLQKVMEHPELVMAMAEQLMQEHSRAEDLSAMLQQVQPKADYYDAFVNPADCTNIRDTAKELQIPERQFTKFLEEAKFLYRCPAGNLMPYNKPTNEGLFLVRDFYAENGHKGVYTLITPLGKDRIRIKLMENPDG
ncbi:MAG: phage antirepressor KilAC domain-containing protein [Clostridia bacterium]|nr:phage antirepressor KilAC domain-containing protein [Clostridia bacterium]